MRFPRIDLKGPAPVCGSPVHAGIDPSVRKRPGFPRTRGDRPSSQTADGWFPRTRGDRPEKKPLNAFPRTRGDRPGEGYLQLGFPRTRGDRPVVLRFESDSPSEGSPVHAGIDLYTKAVNIKEMRFPRTRGDRPVLKTTTRV